MGSIYRDIYSWFAPRKPAGRSAALLGACLLGACTVGPDYQRPAAEVVPVAYKELAGWKPATPRDSEPRGRWWSVFADPVLDRLERQVAIDNQNVRAAEAAYRQAVALVGEAQSALFPALGISPAVSRNSLTGGGGSVNRVTNSKAFVGKAFTEYSLEGSASWTLDVWGAIRRQIEAQGAAAQASAADLANALLAQQALLATDYFNLRAADALIRLLQDTVAQYRLALQITQNQYNAGVVSRADVVTADAQLKTTEAQLVGVGVTRAEFEHAIAVLIGRPPAEVSIAPAALASAVPVAPAGLPSALLERRPDIAAAERAMAQQNALIGVAVAAYYPTITLTGLFGYAGNPLSQLFTAANQIWSLGAAANETLLQGGLRAATLAAAHAGYDQAVATYRQTVLTAFQQVEDNLASLRILEQQAAAVAAAVAASQAAVAVTLNEYRAGTVAYTAVITEQTTLLTNEQAALAVQQSRLLASVGLIAALGGGWRAADLPPPPRLKPAAVLQP
jgi:NodT family efflux transporter outer membrane factor (OMF) lipoprotein